MPNKIFEFLHLRFKVSFKPSQNVVTLRITPHYSLFVTSMLLRTFVLFKKRNRVRGLQNNKKKDCKIKFYLRSINTEFKTLKVVPENLERSKDSSTMWWYGIKLVESICLNIYCIVSLCV